jgi:hypothetical protein
MMFMPRSVFATVHFSIADARNAIGDQSGWQAKAPAPHGYKPFSSAG